jgi:hypothetical protein
MPIVAATRSWKSRAALVGAILLTASLGALAADRYLQAQADQLKTAESGDSGTTTNPPLKFHLRKPLVTGEPAPPLDLPAVGEGEALHLADYRDLRPVVLVFGSFTCDLFQDQLPELARMYERHKGHATFAFIAIREARHPIPGYEFLIEDSKAITPEEAAVQRRTCVGKAIAMSGLPLPAYLDGPDNAACQLYWAWPRRLVVVDREGRIAHDFGASLAHPWDLERLGQVLDALASEEKRTPPG